MDNAVNPGIMVRYRDWLPVTAKTRIITLHEGNTPLILLTNLIAILPYKINWYVKYEGINPSGSFKDRGITLAVSKALEAGQRAIICASTGNTSASAAAYAAKAGIKCFVILPAGQIATGKLAQAIVHGACILPIHGNYDLSLQLVKELAEQLPVTIVNSINPYRVFGQKTAAFECVDVLGEAPDYHCLPVGNGANIYSYWLGYQEYQRAGKCSMVPKMLGVQASGAAPLVNGGIVTNPETVATAIKIGNPQFRVQAQQVQRESGGKFAAVTDAEILSAQQLLATKEGIFAEPASAASIAGVLKWVASGEIAAGSTVICTLTGHGLKDPDSVFKQQKLQLPEYAPDLAQLAAEINRNL